MGWIVSPVSQIEVVTFSFLRMEKNVMDAHRSRYLGDGSLGHPGQMLKWMDLRVSPRLYTLLERCDI